MVCKFLGLVVESSNLVAPTLQLAILSSLASHAQKKGTRHRGRNSMIRGCRDTKNLNHGHGIFRAYKEHL